jgi:hypothetical protein
MKSTPKWTEKDKQNELMSHQENTEYRQSYNDRNLESYKVMITSQKA